MLIATILPKRKLLKFAVFFTNPDNTPASPIPADMVMAMDISEKRGSFLRIPSIPRAASTQVTEAVNTGFIPRIRPMATPAKEVWDNASPIIDSLLQTTTMPIQGITAASRMPTIKALCINAYLNISIFQFLFLF